MSRGLWPGAPTPERMAWMRAVCEPLCERGLVQITQRGVSVGCAGYRGLIRVALTAAGWALVEAQRQDDGEQPVN